MREVLPELLRWWEAGETVGVGTVVATFESAPRPPGASMLVGPGGEAVGSVSGGCVEGAVYELAESVVESGEPVLERYGVSDDDAFAVGLTCGGILDVFVEKMSRQTFPELREIADDIENDRPVAVATVIAHPDAEWVGRRIVVRPEAVDTPPTRSLGSSRADAAVADDVRGLLAAGRNETLTYGPDGERRGEGMRVFVWSFAPAARMLVFGAIDFAAAFTVRAVGQRLVASRGQDTAHVVGHRRVSTGTAQASGGRCVDSLRAYDDATTHPLCIRMRDDGGDGNRPVVLDVIGYLAQLGESLPAHLLHEHVEDPAAGESDCEGVVVADAVPLQHWLARLDDRLGELVDRALDTAARH